ncbi:MAG: NADH-quinone oxidoreductase subunit I [Muribaculaceae bacterium]|nr:NADH-quinone oxidoreductase subunit I [Muribaculaceae bacterium]
MGSIKEYFTEAAKGLKSLVDGMVVTGKELVTPKITEQYPENRATLQIADRFRAELTLIYDKEGRHKCIGCGICQMNCPNGTIQLTTKMVDLPDGKKKRKLDKYMYDLGSCTFCMLCVTTCPQDALEFSNDFEQATFTRNSLVKQLNYRPEPKDEPATPPKPAIDPEKLAKIKAEALAKAAKIKAEREAAAAAGASADTSNSVEKQKPDSSSTPTPSAEDKKSLGDNQDKQPPTNNLGETPQSEDKN